jgi:glycosyltransferase involved in cell wall biosynthesis
VTGRVGARNSGWRVRTGPPTWAGARVVICNGRDTGHPRAGGAEQYCVRIAQHMHSEGATVTLLTARHRGSARSEQVSFGKVVRHGHAYTVYFRTLLWLVAHRRRVDAVLDSQNGIPFFSPLAVSRRTPVLLLIHQVHQRRFTADFRWPRGQIGRWLEATASRWVYRRRAVCVVSPSSRADVRRELALRGPVYLATRGVDGPGAGIPRARSARPVIVCASRLVEHERVHLLLGAMAGVHAGPRGAEPPGAELHIVGDGPARDHLVRLGAALGGAERIFFHGQLPDGERGALIGRAWLGVSASTGGDWGADALEAAAAGVPTVALAVPGLREAIRPGVTGWLVDDVADLTDTLRAALAELAPASAARAWEERCRAWATRFTWPATADRLLGVLDTERIMRRRHAGRDRRIRADSGSVVELPHDLVSRADLTRLRGTDQIRRTADGVTLLLAGADEEEARHALARIGVEQPRECPIRVARQRDLIGWEYSIFRWNIRSDGAAGAPGGPRTAAAAPIPAARQPVDAIDARPAGEPGPPPVNAAPPVGRKRRRPPAALWYSAGAFALALVLRLVFIHRSYDLFIDEVSYAEVGRNIADGSGLILDGHPFHLHPPLLFALIALLVKLTGTHGGLAYTAIDLRPLDAFFGALDCAAVTGFLMFLVRRRLAIAAGLLLALDPFLVSYDSRLLLEAPAMAGAAIGMLLLAVAAETGRAETRIGLIAGFCFAAAIVTKETYGFVSVAPLVILIVAQPGPQRRVRTQALATAVAGYGCYLAGIVLTGQSSGWFAQQTGGLSRLLGRTQITGFNQPHSVSFLSRLLANFTSFVVPYSLIGVGSLAAGWLLLRWLRYPALRAVHPGTTTVAVWCACGAAELAYAMVGGTLEEQMFYPLLVTGVACSAVAAEEFLRHDPRPVRWRIADGAGRRRRHATRWVAVAAVVTFFAATAVDLDVWVRVHTTPDNTYVRMLAWSRQEIPNGSTVSVTDDASQFIMSGVRLGRWSTEPALVANRVDYVLISTTLVDQGYGIATPAFAGLLEKRARLVFDAAGPTMGHLRVYDVRQLVAEDRHSAVKAKETPP